MKKAFAFFSISILCAVLAIRYFRPDFAWFTEASGEKIPLGARIIAIADAYDTITSDRTYKKARKAGDALAELERCANAQFDGAIVEIFVRTLRALPNPVIEVAATTGPRNS